MSQRRSFPCSVGRLSEIERRWVRVIGNLDTFKEGVTEIDGKVQAIDKQINDTSYLEEGVPPS